MEIMVITILPQVVLIEIVAFFIKISTSETALGRRSK